MAGSSGALEAMLAVVGGVESGGVELAVTLEAETDSMIVDEVEARSSGRRTSVEFVLSSRLSRDRDCTMDKFGFDRSDLSLSWP